MREQEVRQPIEGSAMPEASDPEKTILRLREELRLKEEQHLAISRLHQAVSTHPDHDELFEAIAMAASSVLRFRYMAVVLPGVDDQDLLAYLVELKEKRAICHPAQSFPALGTVSAWVIENRESFLAQHLEDLRPFPYCYDGCRKAAIQSHCALPLIIRGRAVGVLVFAGNETGMYPESLLPFLRQFAGAVTIAVDNRLAHDGRARLKGQLALSGLGRADTVSTKGAVESIVGQSQAIKEVLRKIAMVAGTDSSVLISGETGTGKELAARAVHQLSKRSRAPMITVNCAALPVGIIESELFGHEKGAFTGAVARRPGRFELADGGTIFLDEIGELPQEVQAKLLRVLQEAEFERVGGVRTIKVDVRVIAATNRFLLQAVGKEGFRADLFYRLNVFPVHIPPLRERPADILPLAMHLLEKYAARLQKPVHVIDHRTMRRLVSYPWPGNVRELENVIERGLIVSNGPVLELDDDLQPSVPTRASRPRVSGTDPSYAAGTEGEAHRLLELLERSGGNHSRAAKALGIGRTTLWRKLKLHGLACALLAPFGEDLLVAMGLSLAVLVA